MKPNFLKTGLIYLLGAVFLITTIYAANFDTAGYPAKHTFIPILCYHRIIAKIVSPYDLTPAMLEKHLQLLKKEGFHPITSAQYLAFQKHPELFPAKPIILTFDDGNKSHYQRVFPLLKKYGYQATFFVYPNAISNKPQNRYLITWGELSEMVRDGMDIESHTFSHPFLTNYKMAVDNPPYLAWLEHEFNDSKTVIERKLNIKVNLLAYSYGWYNSAVEAKAVAAGYQGLFTTNWGSNFTTENPFRLKRKVISNILSIKDLDRYINSRPMAIDIISPQDGEIVTKMPVIKFRLHNQLKKITLVMRRSKWLLIPDRQGNVVFDKLGVLKPGFYMIILSGYDGKMNYYLNSWGFDYRKPGVIKARL